MKNRLIISSILFLLFSLLVGCAIYYFKKEKERYTGIIYSCKGWQLNRYPEIKNFIKDDLKNFNVEVLYTGGEPRLVIYTSNKTEIETIKLAPYNRQQLNELFKSKGLKK